MCRLFQLVLFAFTFGLVSVVLCKYIHTYSHIFFPTCFLCFFLFISFLYLTFLCLRNFFLFALHSALCSPSNFPHSPVNGCNLPALWSCNHSPRVYVWKYRQLFFLWHDLCQFLAVNLLVSHL